MNNCESNESYEIKEAFTNWFAWVVIEDDGTEKLVAHNSSITGVLPLVAKTEEEADMLFNLFKLDFDVRSENIYLVEYKAVKVRQNYVLHS